MNTSRDPFEDAFMKNLISVGLGVIITYINGMFVFAFFKSPVFYNDPRYILYIHLIINDIIMLFISVILHIMAYTVPLVNVTVCCFLLLFASSTSENTALNLAGMSLERYIAICRPLHHPQLCTVRRTYILLGLIWLLSTGSVLIDVIIVLVNNPISFFLTSIMCYSKSLFGTEQHLNKAIIIQVLFLTFVWITLLFTYCNVLLAAKAATSDAASVKKARNTILLHGVQLLLCMLSYVAPIINYHFLVMFPKYKSTIMFSTYLLSNVSPRLLSALIYGVRDQKMFKYVTMYFTCLLSTQVEPNSKELKA